MSAELLTDDVLDALSVQADKPGPVTFMRGHARALLDEVDRQKVALATIATIANALGDSLPGDNWSAANAIHEIATGKVTPKQGLADAWGEDDDED